MFLSKKTLLAAFLLVVGCFTLSGQPAAAATRTHFETTLRVYNAAGSIIVPQITLASDTKNLTSAGLDLFTNPGGAQVLGAEQGDIYLGVRGTTPYLLANALGQGGLYRLTKVSAAAPLNKTVAANKKGVTYVRTGVPVSKDAIFAVYDTHSKTYFKIRVLSIKRTTIPDLSGTPTITSPKNDTDLTSLETNLSISWKGVLGAEKYMLVLNCTSCDAAWETHRYEFTGATQKYLLPLSGLPSGKQYYNVTVQAVQGTATTPRSFPVYFTYTNSSVAPIMSGSVAKPVLTSPTQNQVFTLSPRTVTVGWGTVSGASKYEVAVDCDSCGMTAGWNAYTTYSTTQTSQVITLPEDKTYTVSVRAFDQNGISGSLSEKITFRFNRNVATSSIVPPVITGPTAGAVLGYFPRVIHATWWKVAGASNYILSLECESCSGNGWKEVSSNTINNSVGTASSFDLPALAIDSEYRIRMRSVDGAGAAGPWSEYVNFRFSTISIDVPAITSPATGQTLTNSPRTFGVMWNAVRSAVSYVVQVDCKDCTSSAWGKTDYQATTDDATWVVMTAPSDGQYRVRVQAVDQYGNRTAWSAYTNFSFSTATNTQIAAPRVTGPLTGSEVIGEGKKVSLSWSSAGNFYHYEIILECNSCGTTTGWKYVKAYRTADTSTSLLVTLPQDGNYRFQIRAIDVDANRAGQWSDLTTFSYTSR